MKNKLGVIVIGQSPRPDCEAYFKKCLQEEDEVIVKGALDDLTPSELKDIRPKDHEDILIALDRNLSPIIVPEQEVIKRLHGKIVEMENEGANLIVVYCSGQFEEMDSKVPLILPGEILLHNILAIAKGRKVGVIVPEKEQIHRTREKLISVNIQPCVEAASPYGSIESIREACKRIMDFDPELIVMDCTSYGHKMKEIVREATGKPVITAESILAKIVSELAGI